MTTPKKKKLKEQYWAIKIGGRFYASSNEGTPWLYPTEESAEWTQSWAFMDTKKRARIVKVEVREI